MANSKKTLKKLKRARRELPRKRPIAIPTLQNKGAQRVMSNRFNDLTVQSLKFLDLYLLDPMNPARALVEAGYTVPNPSQYAQKLLKDKRMRVALDARRQLLTRKVDTSVARIIEELHLIAMSDPIDLFDESGGVLPLSKMKPEMRRAIMSIEVISKRSVGGNRIKKNAKGEIVGPQSIITKFKLHPKTAALDMLGRYRKMFDVRTTLDEDKDRLTIDLVRKFLNSNDPAKNAIDVTPERSGGVEALPSPSPASVGAETVVEEMASPLGTEPLSIEDIKDLRE